MRIVSLCPSLSELVFDLGIEPLAITSWCCHPADRVGAIEKVGGTKNPDVARIIELAPDLVLMNDEENRLEDADVLRSAGIAIHSSFPRTVDDTAAMVRSIAAALDRVDPGERIAQDIEARAAAIRLECDNGPVVRYAYLIWRKPWMAVGADTFVAGLFLIAAAENIFPGGSAPDERYPAIAADDLQRLQPDVVFLPNEPFAFNEGHVAELARLTGLSATRFQLVDGERLSWHGSRTPSGIDYAAEVLRPYRHRSLNE